MKNLLNNLLNWVLKKGSSETKKEQAWEEKEQAGSKKDQVKRTKLGEKDQVKGSKLVQKRSKLSEKDQVKGTKLSEKEQAGSKKEQAEQKGNKLGEKGTSLEMNPCVMGSEVREVMGSEAMSVKGSEAVRANHALITQLSRNNHPISLRAIRYAAVLFMVFMVGIGQMWGADIDNFATGFENGVSNVTFSGSGESASACTTSADVRTGGKSLQTAVTGSTNEKKPKLNETYSVPKSSYLHAIAYAKLASTDTEITTATARINLYVGGNKTASTTTISTSWQKIKHSFQYTSSGTKTGCYVELWRTHPTKGGSIYFDDVIVYVSTNSTLDEVVPNAATAASATTSSISWTNGSDANTGIQNTLIWHRTSGSSDDLTLNNQGIYSLTSTVGPSTDQSGHWTLVSASVGASATSYDGTFSAGDRYAIVHRDLAYNYSTPTYVTVPAASSCTAPDHVDISGAWDKFGGETISLTATAYSSAGTGSPIADGNITGWQWEKLVGSTWTALSNGTAAGVTTSGATTKNLQISNCGQGNSGKYRCVVSTGATCSTASATATDGSEGYVVKVYALECYTGDTTVYNFTRDGNNQRGSVSIALTASTGYEFKIHADKYYGNNGTINFDENNWTFTAAGNNVTVNSGLGGTFTFTIDYSSNGDVPVLAVTYPRKRIYLSPGVWDADGAKFAYYYFHKTGDNTDAEGWTGFLTNNDCGMYADIPQWNGVKMIAVRFNPSDATPGWNGDGHVWNQTSDLTVTSNDLITITGWNNSQTYNSTYSTPTYTISYNKGTNGTGSKANESKTCGVAFTLPGSTFTYAGHSQDGWATTDGGATAYALSGSYTTNAAQEFFPHWKCNTPTITDNGDNTVTITVPAGTTVRYTTDGTNPTSSTGTVYSSAFTIDATVTVKAIAYQSNCTDSEVASQACTYHAPAASLTAISADVLYQAADMANITFTGSDQYWAGLSTNNLFQTYGNGTSNSAKGKTISSTNVTDDISTKSFTSHAFVEGSDVTSGTADPTYGAIEFITPSTAGLLYVYTVDGSSSNLKLRKKGSSTFTALTGSSNYNAIAVDANSNYYIHGNAGKRGIYGIQYVSTYAVSITPTNVTKATGATGAGAAIKGKAYTATFTAPVGYTLPSDVTSLTIGGTPQTKGSGYIWTISDGTATLTIPAANVTGAISITVTGVAAESYSITYDCDGAESGCPSNVAAAYTLPSPLPSAPTKDGYDFVGWYTNSTKTVAAVAGAALSENTTLYAKWTVHSASECITITNFATSNTSCSNNIPDNNSKYFYGYKGTVDDAHAVTITSNDGNDRGQNSGVEMRLTYNKKMRIYANNTTNATPAGFENVVSVSFKWKFIASGNSGNTELTSSYTVKVGSTTIANAVSITGKTNDGYATVTIDNLAQLNGYIEFLFGGSSSSYNVYLDDIEICTADMAACTTPNLPTATLNDQALCEGADIAAWDATPTNASTISSKSESISYSWKKKGNDTELATTATFDLGASAAESQAGTYVVTVTVSKAGYTSATVSEEMELSVTEGTEAPTVTQSTTPVYEGNSVTLTATATTGATYTWHTCNADGTGESSAISGATTNAYTIASAPAAGTHYYKVKVTGDGTHTCGNAETVYALTVSEAAGGDCFHFVSVIPESNINISSGASIVTPTHATTLEGGTMKVGSQQVVITAGYGLKMEGTKTVSITLDAALEAGNVVIVKGTSATKGYGITINGVNFYDADNKTFDVSYTVSADDGLEGQTALSVSKYSGSSYLQEIKITGCGESCTDPEVTASANNTTACAGSSVTFTAANAHASADYQWQKLDGTWTNISGANASTYNIASVVAGDAGKYRVIATHDCSRTSNEVTLSVPVAPVFGSFTATRSVMATLALSITDVEASDATSYAWYKSVDATYDAGSDTRVGTAQELLLAAGGEAAGDTYYLFCVASNSCGSTTSSAITVNVIALVEEDCATKGNEGAADFGFTKESGVGESSVSSQSCWTSGGKAKYLTYTAPDGKYFDNAKVTVAVSSGSVAAYGYSTDGSSYTYANLTGLSSALAEKAIDLPANVTHFRIGRNFDPSYGVTSGTFYLSKACFEYTNACTATTVTPSTASVGYEMGDEWSNPTFTLTPAAVSGETLTYSSSNEDIASVDDNGTVTFNGNAGTVTITASYAGGTISETEYCASSGSYTITVSCPGDAPKVVADGTVNMSGCNSSVILNAKKQDGTTDFTGGSYQWFRNGEEIDGATSSSYTAAQTGVYTVAYTSAGGCTSPSTNSATVTSATVEPEVTKLVPFQYYHVDKTYTTQMKDRHLFSVKGSAEYGSTGKNFKLTMSRNGGEAVDMTTAASIFVTKSRDGQIDTVMIDLNKLSGKYSEGDELVLTCAAVNCSGNVSAVYKDEITINVIGTTPTLALICSGSSKAGGTRKTSELTVGGDFLTGYNVADLCQQTGNTSFDANTEWGLYTDLKTQYIVTPVNGYAVFNKLNYEPFDILLLTDYPKASKSDAAKDVLDDMAALCDYRPMLSFKTHMVAKSPSKWAAKGFTTSATENKADGRLNLNIVCYAHPMFNSLKTGDDVYTDVGNTSAPLVYTMLSGTGYESSKGMQGFELAAAENFITIGLTHYNGTIAKDSPDPGEVEWTPGSGDRMLVTVAERQANPEARFILFSLNCGAQSKLTEKGEDVVLACLNYLLGTAEGTIEPADCSFTFDNGESNEHDASWYSSNCPSCTGTKGDGLWTTAANWGPDYRLLPGEFNSVRIKKQVEVNDEHAHVMDVRIIDEGRIDIPAGKALDVKSTIRRMDGSEIYPTEENDIHVGSASTGNGTLIFNNDEGDTKARVDMYSKGFIDGSGEKNFQYIGTPFVEVNALYNYYGSWIYWWNGSNWKAVKNGGPMTAWTGYCITQEAPTYHQMSGTLTATTTVDIPVGAGQDMVVGNSWTAPIDINAMTTEDFENLTANVYFFNTGVEKDHTMTGHVNDGIDRYAGGTYVTVPIHSAPYTGDDHIPSLQGFFVTSSGSAGTLHLDYDKHVRGTTRDNILSGAMHAPARRAAVNSNEPTVLKIKVSGENYDDKLLLLEREDFTEGFDNGWDGDKWDGNESALYIYTTDSEGTENSVSAIPELEGTVIGFRAGEDDAYTLNFEYLNSDEPLYLYDVENNTYTQIITGMTYRFFTTDNEKHERFIITRSNGQEVATDIGNGEASGNVRAKKFILNDKMYIMINGLLYDATGKVVK